MILSFLFSFLTFAAQTPLSHFAVTDQDVLRAPCRSYDDLETIMDQEIERLMSIDPESHPRSIPSFQSQLSQGRLQKAFRDLTYPLKTEYRPVTKQYSFGILETFDPVVVRDESLWVDLDQTFSITKKCQGMDLVCAIHQIWGKDLGRIIWFSKLKFDVNLSEYVFHNATRFPVSEALAVVRGLLDLPDFFYPIEANKQISRFLPGHTLEMYGQNSGIHANALIQLFDGWRRFTDPMKEYGVFHELSHNVAIKDEILKEPRFQEAIHKDSGCVISQYSKDSTHELFAEVMSAYRYRADELLLNCPYTFEYLKEDLFRQRTFLQNSRCSDL